MADSGSIVCPIPTGISHDEARAMFKQIHKEMPRLSPAATRREAARRMGIDYDTYLEAWKKPKVIVHPDVRPVPLDDVKPIVKPEPKPDLPSPSPVEITHETARETYKSVKRELPGLTDAQVRHEAAKRMNVDYDAYLKAWKKPTDTTPKPALPKDKPDTTYVKPNPPARLSHTDVNKRLKDAGFKESQVVKSRRTHTGREYGGGDSATEGFELVKAMSSDEQVFFRYTPRFGDSAAEAQAKIEQMMDVLRGQGFVVDKGITNLQRIIRLPEKPIEPWKRKGNLRVDRGIPNGVTTRRESIYTVFERDGKEIARVFDDGFRGGFHVTMKGAPRQVQVGTYEEAIEVLARWDAHKMLPDVFEVNPGYGIRGTTRNCPSTTTSWELRKRGYNVKAMKMDDGANVIEIYQSWGIKAKNMMGPDAKRVHPDGSYPMQCTQKQFIQEALDMPDGARGFIIVNWNRSGSHIFNWEKRNGRIHYIDAQPGLEFTDDRYWKKAEPLIFATRVDNVEYDRKKLSWLTTDGKDQIKSPGPGALWR